MTQAACSWDSVTGPDHTAPFSAPLGYHMNKLPRGDGGGLCTALGKGAFYGLWRELLLFTGREGCEGVSQSTLKWSPFG